MAQKGREKLVKRFQVASCLLGLAVVVIGATALFGWIFNITSLKSLSMTLVTMKVNSAIAFVLMGSALVLIHTRPQTSFLGLRLVHVFPALTILIGLATLFEYIFKMRIGIDEFLFYDNSSPQKIVFPGRMAPNTAFSFILLGFALLLTNIRDGKWYHPTEMLAVVTFVVAMVPFTGFLYGVPELVRYTNRFPIMTLHTSGAFLLLSSGILVLQPNRGWMKLAIDPGEAGVIIRGLLPLIILILVLLGWLRIYGEQFGLFSSVVGTALFVVLRALIIGIIIIGVARVVYNLELQRRQIQEQVENANAILNQTVSARTAEIEAARLQLKYQHDFLGKIMESSGALILVIDPARRILRFNHACEETTGYAAAEVLNKVFCGVFFNPLEKRDFCQAIEEVYAGNAPDTREDAWLCKDGTTRWIRWRGTGMAESEGPVTHCIIAGIDVTERKRAEERVWKNEERLQGIMDHLPVGVVLSTGLEQRILYVNPCFHEYFPPSDQENEKMTSWWEQALPDPDYRATIQWEWERRLEEASFLQTEIQPMHVEIAANDGTVKYLRVHATVFGDLTFITFVDLTERQKAESARRLNEMRLEALLNLNQMTKASMKELTDFVLEEAVRLTGSKIGYLAFMNEDESVLTMYSWSKTAMQECAMREKPLIYPVKDTGLWGEAVRQRSAVITNDYDAPNPLKKGYPEGHVPIRRHMNIPVMDEGRIVLVAGVGNKNEPYDNSDVRQLTLLMDGMWRLLQRRKHEEEIRHMRSYLQNVVDSMPTMLIGVDLDGTIIHWNREAAKFTGFSDEASYGKEIGEVLPQLHAHLDKIKSAIREGRGLERERISMRNSQDENQIFEIMVFPLIANGASGAVVRLDDVTTRVQIEEMMVQTEKMMSVGGLAAGMAHEINNPLGGILQACQNIERRTSLDLPKNLEVADALGVDLSKVREYLAKRDILEFISCIRSDGTRAARIVSDMLAFSRRTDSQLLPTQVEEIVDTVLRLAANDYDLKKQYDFRNIKITREYEEGLPEVQCDKTKIEQVLLNLVKNAAQAMAGWQGKEIPKIIIRACKDPHHLQVEVIDNGPGMEESIRRRVFEPFFTTKEVGVGTGLGLSVSYFIITRQHKGEMSVESTPGEGCRFIVRLPLEQKV